MYSLTKERKGYRIVVESEELPESKIRTTSWVNGWTFDRYIIEKDSTGWPTDKIDCEVEMSIIINHIEAGQLIRHTHKDRAGDTYFWSINYDTTGMVEAACKAIDFFALDKGE